MQSKTISYQSKNIHYTVIGNGKPVVLLHGFGEDSDVWKYQIDFLKNHYTLIVPDIPGSGKSELIPNANIDMYAEVVKHIINEEFRNTFPTGGGREGAVSLIGHSMGGYITLAFAEKYPQLLNSFCLFHSSAFADTEEKKQARKKSIEFIKTHSVNAFLETSIPGLFSDEFKTNHPQAIKDLIERGNNSFSKEALVQYYEAMIARPDRTAILENFNNPILFIIGKHDKAVPMEAGLQQSHLPTISNVHILHKSAHMGMWEETTKANNCLFNFLSTVF